MIAQISKGLIALGIGELGDLACSVYPDVRAYRDGDEWFVLAGNEIIGRGDTREEAWQEADARAESKVAA